MRNGRQKRHPVFAFAALVWRGAVRSTRSRPGQFDAALQEPSKPAEQEHDGTLHDCDACGWAAKHEGRARVVRDFQRGPSEDTMHLTPLGAGS